MYMVTRRVFFSTLGGAAAVARLSAFQSSDLAARKAAILARIHPPQFPDRIFDITKYGAADGAESGAAIAKAIDACAKAGGGTVLAPRGTFPTGPIHLKSNVNLHVAEGAVLRFSTDPKRYLPLVYTRWESTECMNYSPLIYAFEQTNIAVTGAGTLDGQADEQHWWPWKGNTKFGYKKGDPEQQPSRAALVAMGEKDVPVSERKMGEGHYLRPNFIQPYRCTNVLVEGVTIIRSPMWEVNPVLSKNVTVRDVKINSHGPNNDGCDPDACTDVLIDHCEFDTGDDCIAIKSGRNRDGRRVGVACENLVVQNCTMKDGHGGVSIGSEASGGVRNVFIDNCRMDSPHLERALRIKTNSYRGGVIENVYLMNTTVGQVAEAVLDIDFNYEEGKGGPFQPVVRNVVLDHVTSHKSKYGLTLRGFENAPITGVRLIDCKFENVAQADVIENVKGLER
jgi:polygalacturonase